MRLTTAALTLATVLAVAGCTSAMPSSPGPPVSGTPGSGGTGHHHRPHHHRPSSSPPSSSPTSPSQATTSGSPTDPATSTSSTGSGPDEATARAALARMTLAQRVGQLLMVDCPSTGVAPATTTAIERYHVGSVILDGTTTSGVDAVRSVTSRLQGMSPSGVGLFVATDQEGGEVQRLQGPGFDQIPSGVDQGSIAPNTLRADAQKWGDQLAAAGVDVNLAPVLDTVPAGFGSNPPIGNLDREYGHTPATVRRHGLAYAEGMADAGIDATAKHFPGLGRVHGNTDLRSNVRDTVTTRDDPYLAPFRAAAEQPVPFLMMSTAIYTHLDPGTPAAFSHTIVTGMVRGDLGYQGVIISDDLGAAAQVSAYPVGERAVDFVAAGGDMVLTVDATQAQAMTGALIDRAQSDPAFRDQVDAAALTVLEAKAAAGLLH